MVSMMELRHLIMIGSTPKSSELPPAYERIPYVTTDGNQVIRSDYVPVRYDEFHIRFNGVNGTLLSAGTGTYPLLLLSGFSNTGWYYKNMNSTTVNVTAQYAANTWYDVDIDSDGTLRTNGKSYACAYQAELDGTATNMYLFERRNWSSRYTGSVSEFWIKNNGEYKMYLIPCIRKSDQKVGMYDTVSKTFLTSARNDFIAGT